MNLNTLITTLNVNELTPEQKLQLFMAFQNQQQAQNQQPVQSQLPVQLMQIQQLLQSQQHLQPQQLLQSQQLQTQHVPQQQPPSFNSSLEYQLEVLKAEEMDLKRRLAAQLSIPQNRVESITASDDLISTLFQHMNGNLQNSDGLTAANSLTATSSLTAPNTLTVQNTSLTNNVNSLPPAPVKVENIGPVEKNLVRNDDSPLVQVKEERLNDTNMNNNSTSNTRNFSQPAPPQTDISEPKLEAKSQVRRIVTPGGSVISVVKGRRRQPVSQAPPQAPKSEPPTPSSTPNSLPPLLDHSDVASTDRSSPLAGKRQRQDEPPESTQSTSPLSKVPKFVATKPPPNATDKRTASPEEIKPKTAPRCPRPPSPPELVISDDEMDECMICQDEIPRMHDDPQRAMMHHMAAIHDDIPEGIKVATDTVKTQCEQCLDYFPDNYVKMQHIHKVCQAMATGGQKPVEGCEQCELASEQSDQILMQHLQEVHNILPFGTEERQGEATAQCRLCLKWFSELILGKHENQCRKPII